LLFLVLLSVAILRYRLWDLDLIINRTLVYAALTTILVITYYSSVVFLQQLVGVFVELQDSTFLIVLSTLAISVLFNPLRRRLQLIVDRRFFRKKYDAVKTMEDYSKSLRDEVDLDQMSGRLILLAEETMMPEHVSLWMVESGFKPGLEIEAGIPPFKSSQ
jgi:amino acid transporter